MRLISLGMMAMCAALLAGCAGEGGSGGASPASFAQFTDMPMPAGSTMDSGNSQLFGNGDTWFGHLTIQKSFGTAATLYDFYKAQMPAFGWQEISSMRGSTSLQTWQRGGRVATVSFTESACVMGTCAWADAMITVSPATQGGAAPGGPADAAPPPPAPMETPPAVSAEPLK